MISMKAMRLSLIIMFLFTGCKRENVPTVTTTDVTSITQTSATSGGEIISQGDSEVTEKGVCWSTSDNPTILDSIKIDDSDNNSYTIDLKKLNPDTEYFVRAFAINNIGIGYGKTKSFTTEAASLPEITTIYPYSIKCNTVRSGGNIITDGASPIFDRGLCWSTSSNPTLSGNHISAGSGSNMFLVTITGLESNTSYYIRSYATNSVGTAYGESILITTCLDLNSNPIDPVTIVLWNKPLDTIRKYIQGKWRIVVVGGGIGGGYFCYNDFFSEFTIDDKFISNVFRTATDTSLIKWERKQYLNSPDMDSIYIMTLTTGSSYVIEKNLYDTLVYYQYPDIDASYFYGIKYK